MLLALPEKDLTAKVIAKELTLIVYPESPKMICEQCLAGIKTLVSLDVEPQQTRRTFGEVLAAARQAKTLENAGTCKHHQSLNALLEAVKSGCYICNKLSLQIRNEQQVSDLSKFFAERPLNCTIKLRTDFGDQAPFYNLELLTKSDEMYESTFSFNLNPLYDSGL